MSDAALLNSYRFLVIEILDYLQATPDTLLDICEWAPGVRDAVADYTGSTASMSSEHKHNEIRRAPNG